MATHTATLEQLSASSISATVLKLTPMLLAAVLVVGCSTKAQRIGSLSGDPSMAESANSKGRGGVPDAAQPGAANSLTASQSGKESAEAGAGSTSTPNDASGGDDLASKQADASPSSDEAATSSSSDGVGGAGSSGRDGAGGDQASSLAGGAAGVAGRDATGKGNTAAPGRSGSARGGVPGASAGAGGSGKPGASGGKDASPLTGDSAGAGRERAGTGDSSGLDAGGADLSSGGALAGLESDAAVGTGGRRGAPGRRGVGSNASGTSDDRTGMGGSAAGGVEGDARIAAIDVPSGNVKVDEEYRPQTLGGVLPLVLGVNEEGRFDFDQYSLRPDVKRILDELAGKLKTAEYDRLDIVGYTDRIGSTDYNRRLSELRAYAVAQYLMGRGVPENKIRYEGRGEKSPLTPSGECQGLAREELITCLQKDRRVEIEASIHRKHATVIQ